MLPSYIEASTFAETFGKQQHPRYLDHSKDCLFRARSSSSQSSAGFLPAAPRGTTLPQLTSRHSPDEIRAFPSYSVHMGTRSTQEKSEKASRRVSTNSWLPFDSNVATGRTSSNEPVYAATVERDHMGPSTCLNPQASVAMAFPKGIGEGNKTSTSEPFAATPPTGWIDFEPTPLPSGFASKWKTGLISDDSTLHQEISNPFSSDSSNRKRLHELSQRDTTTALLRANTVSDEPSIVSTTDSGRVTPTTADLDTCGSLLHESCRLYPNTRAVVESALRLNPSSVNQRRLPTKLSSPCNQKELKTSSSGASASPYPTGCTLPLNIALENSASLDVVNLLVQECPEVILTEDGPQACGSLSVALYHSAPCDVILSLTLAKPDSVKMVDRRHSNLALHVACAKGAAFEIIQALVQLYPKALHHRNFHGQTPLDICQRHSSVCSDRVTDFLQEATFRNASTDLESILDAGLDSEDYDV